MRAKLPLTSYASVWQRARNGIYGKGNMGSWSSYECLRQKGLDEAEEFSGCQMAHRLAARLLRAKGMSEMPDPNRDLVTGQEQAGRLHHNPHHV